MAMDMATDMAMAMAKAMAMAHGHAQDPEGPHILLWTCRKKASV